MNIQKLMQEAQKMQAKMQEAQKELETLAVVGEAGGGLVKIKMTGKHEVLETVFSNNIWDECAEDVNMLADLVTSAVNDAVRKIEKETRGRIQDLTAGINLPGDLGGITGN